MVAIKGDMAEDVRAFFEAYGQPWFDRDAEAIASHYNQPLSMIRSGVLAVFATQQAVLDNTKQVLSMWHPEGSSEDVATQLTEHGAGRSAVVHAKWGRWIVRLPDGGVVIAPECDYVLAKPQGQWKIILTAVDWNKTTNAPS